mgnify:CR=1 FL=1
MIGQNIGAGKYDRVPLILRSSFLFAGIICGIMCAALLLFPSVVFGLFVREEQTLEAAMVYVPVAIVCLCSCIARQPMMSLIYGSGNSIMNLFVALLDGVIGRIGLALLLGELVGLGIYGYWYGNALSGFIPFFIGAAYYASGRWRRSRIVILPPSDTTDKSEKIFNCGRK